MSDVIITQQPESFTVYADRILWLGRMGQKSDKDYSCRTIFNKDTGGLADEWWIRDPEIRTLFALRWGL